MGSEPRSRGLGAAWAAIAVVAVALRVVAGIRPRIIEHDGAYYANLAAALLRGDAGIGLSTMWPPLYPLLIAAAAGIARVWGAVATPESLESAARAVSIVAGLATLVPLHRLARRVWGDRVALAAVMLAAVHPRLVQYSGAALTESIFTALVVCGVAAWCARQQALAGISLGLAALARPEGAVLAFALWLVGLFAREPDSRRIRPAFVAAFVLMVLPYATWVSLQTGTPSLGEKGAYNFWRAYKVEYAQVLPEPAGLSERATDGPELMSGLPQAHVDVAGFVARRPGVVLARTASNLGRIVTSSLPLAVYPLFALLALVGAWRAPWSTAWPVGLPVIVSTLLYAPLSPDRRFFVPVVPFVVILAAGGLEPIARRLAGRAGEATQVARLTTSIALVVAVGHGAYSLLAVRPIDQAPEHRAAGVWLRARWADAAAAAGEPTSRPVVMSRKPWVAYYSGGANAELPEGDLPAIEARMLTTGTDVLVVDARWGVPQRPALAPLLPTGRTDRAPRPLYWDEARPAIALHDARALLRARLEVTPPETP